MERQIPKNVRQIGNVSDNPKIYVEDYVDTFFNHLCEKCLKSGNQPTGAFLVGDLQSEEGGEDYVYIYGAIQMHELKMEGNEYVIDNDTWKQAYEDCKQYFEDGEMLGWIVVHPGVPLTPGESSVKLHKKSFPKKNTVFIMKDPVENEEAYYVHKLDDLMAIGGHYIYYEKNPSMQNYIVSARKKNGVFLSETVEDRAAKDFRNLVRKRVQNRKTRRGGGLMYAVSACLVLIVIIMGVAMMNSYDRMQNVQNTLETLAGTTDTADTQETSGNVTAVTSGEQTAKGQAQKDENSEDSQDTQSDLSSKTDQQETDEKDQDDKQSQDKQNTDAQSQDVSSDQIKNTEEISSEDEKSAETFPTEGNGSDGIYSVEEGDTLAIISRKMYGDVSHVDAICRMNGITDGNLIYVGQKLLLP